MRFGYDDHKVRIKPTYSGQRATCPFCEGLLIGKCGDIYVKHWQHHKDRRCDPWQEHETVWHRNWKDNFPNDWQEVIMEVGAEKHIADVRTSQGIVIELQNSPISTTTIKIRENFYKNMIWIVNAEQFMDNFKITSAVKTGLRRLEHEARYKSDSIRDAYSDEYKLLQKEIDNKTVQIREKKQTLKSKEKKSDNLIEKGEHFDKFIDELIERWTKGGFYYDPPVSNEMESLYRKPLMEVSKEINQIHSDIENLENRLKYVDDLEDFEFGGKQLKIVDRTLINNESFQKVKVVSKATRRNIFPEVKEFNSELEYSHFVNSHRYNKDNFDFAFDVEEKLNGLLTSIREKRQSFAILEGAFKDENEKVKLGISQNLELLVKETEDDIEKLNAEWDALILENNQLIAQQEELRKEEKNYIDFSQDNLEKEMDAQRVRIMKNNKGIYFFDWKHERKSWKAAKCPVFFDTGRGFLFERTDTGVFKKTQIEDFLANHLRLLKGMP